MPQVYRQAWGIFYGEQGLMTKIQRVSFYFRIFFQIVFVMFALMPVAQWVLLPYYMRLLPVHIPITHTITWVDQLIGFSISIVPATISLLITYQLIQLFRLYENDKILTYANAERIRKISYLLIASQVISPIYEAFLSFALTWRNTYGPKFISTSFGGTNVTVIVIGLLILVVSWIMMEGAKAHEENKQFI